LRYTQIREPVSADGSDEYDHTGAALEARLAVAENQRATCLAEVRAEDAERALVVAERERDDANGAATRKWLITTLMALAALVLGAIGAAQTLRNLLR
jgi:hypothetical protein